MYAKTSRARNARILKGLSLLYLGLIFASLLLVHGESYRPAVSYVPLYLIVSVILTAAAALLLLPASTFSEGFRAGSYVFFAFFLAAATFFTGGVSSELYVLFFPLVFASALHGSWRVGLLALGAALVSYSLAMLPDTLRNVEGADDAALVFFRLTAFALAGIFALMVAGGRPSGEGAYDADGPAFMEQVSGEIEKRRGTRVGVVLVDPGDGVEDVDLLVERVRSRAGDPVLLGEGAVFGMILQDAGDDRTVEDVARRALAAASSLGATGARAGAALYPRDASSAQDLLAAAGGALETALETGAAVVLARTPGRRDPGGDSFPAAR